MFFGRHTYLAVFVPSEENVFSSQKITLSQKASGLSAYCKAYSIRFSMLIGVNSGFFAGVRACKPLSRCLARIVSKEHDSLKLPWMSCALQNGSSLVILAIAWLKKRKDKITYRFSYHFLLHVATSSSYRFGNKFRVATLCWEANNLNYLRSPDIFKITHVYV